MPRTVVVNAEALKRLAAARVARGRCRHCDGPVPCWSPFGDHHPGVANCRRCSGTGRRGTRRCKACKGLGY